MDPMGIEMGVSLNGGTPKSSILIGFSIINHPFWGTTILGNPQIKTIKKFQFVLHTYGPAALTSGPSKIEGVDGVTSFLWPSFSPLYSGLFVVGFWVYPHYILVYPHYISFFVSFRFTQFGFT